MDKPFHKVITLRDRTYQSLARVQLKEMAVEAGFTNHRLGEIEIIISEITSNLAKHTLQGGIILCRIGTPDDPFIEFISIDKGPGMISPKKMMIDGASTTKTLGQGLGAIQRLSSEFDLYSQKDWGTILFSRNQSTVKKPVSSIKVDVLRTAKDGELACGDNWFLRVKPKSVHLAVIDGLGHGPEASAAAVNAVSALEKSENASPDQQLRFVHESIKRSRGVVMSVFHLDFVNRQATYCGVGNISAKILPRNLEARGKTCNSYNGILGHTMPGSLGNNFSPMDPKLDVLVIHSDGVSAKWDLRNYPTVFQHHPMILCAVLYKDFARGNDDVTIAVVK